MNEQAARHLLRVALGAGRRSGASAPGDGWPALAVDEAPSIARDGRSGAEAITEPPAVGRAHGRTSKSAYRCGFEAAQEKRQGGRGSLEFATGGVRTVAPGCETQATF